MAIVELHISTVVVEQNTPEDAVDKRQAVVVVEQNTLLLVVGINISVVSVELKIPEVEVGNRLQEVELQGNLPVEADRDMLEEVVQLRLEAMAQDIAEQVAGMNS